MYEFMTPEEKALFKESIRLFRHPSFAKSGGNFYQANEQQNDTDPYNSYAEAFKKHIKEHYNISIFDRDKDNGKGDTDLQTESDKNANIGKEYFRDNKDEKKETATNLFSNNSSQEDKTQFPNRRNSFRRDSLSKSNLEMTQKLETDKSSQNISTKHEDMTYSNKDEKKEITTNSSSNTKSQESEIKFPSRRRSSYEQVLPTRNEIDEIVKAIHTPNPPTPYFARSGPGVHYAEEESQKDLKEFLETQRRLGGTDDLHKTGPSMQEDIKSATYSQEYDPLMVDKQKQPDTNISYFKQWQQNIMKKFRK